MKVWKLRQNYVNNNTFENYISKSYKKTIQMRSHN